MFNPRQHIVSYRDSFKNSIHIIHEINKIVNNHWRGGSLSYSSTSGPTKELWWNEFRQSFT